MHLYNTNGADRHNADWQFTPGPQPEPRTIGEIAEIEPRIAAIVRDAERLRKGRRNWRNYEALKCRASRLVGWFAADARLRSCEAYDVVLAAIVRGGGF